MRLIFHHSYNSALYDYIIIITHRNKILEKVDRIIQLENGVVISDRIVQQDAAK